MLKKWFKSNLTYIISIFILGAVVIFGVYYLMFSDRPLSNTGVYEKPLNDAEVSQKSAGTGRVLKLKESDEEDSKESLSIVDIAKKVSPSVVGIRTVATGSRKRVISNLDKPLAEGSGIIISEEGYILTNYHVVQYADPGESISKLCALEVFLPDERQAEAVFIGGDRMNDLAVIKIEMDNLPVAELGDSSELEVGETAVAIGNTLGLEFAGSVTVGVISALDRVIATENIFLSLIQTDAAISPGNSGGALVNSKGQVIGVNSIKIVVPGVEGLGFAIPINNAKDIAGQLVRYGYVNERPSTGISGKVVSETIARILGIHPGIYVVKVIPGGSAEMAGIMEGDILVSLADKEIRNFKDFYMTEAKHKAGDIASALIIRNGQQIKVEIMF